MKHVYGNVPCLMTWGNHNKIGAIQEHMGAVRHQRQVILAGDNPRCDTDAAQMYLRQKVRDKWGAARGTPVWYNKEDDSLSLQVQVQPTICEVRGVERQPAAEVLINPPAGLEEIFTLRTEGKRSEFHRGHANPAAAAACTCRRASMRHLQARTVTAVAN